eukprot:2224089-Amphidinium_carterae.1
MNEAYRWEQARDRQVRREEGAQTRFKGTKEELQRMRDALCDIIVTGRRQRLQERERTRPYPKAPPQGVRLPQDAINRMTIQELRALVRQEEERIAQHQGGAY